MLQGDVLWVPGGTAHVTWNLEPSASVTANAIAAWEYSSLEAVCTEGTGRPMDFMRLWVLVGACMHRRCAVARVTRTQVALRVRGTLRRQQFSMGGELLRVDAFRLLA
jgi:hypothetical protein